MILFVEDDAKDRLLIQTSLATSKHRERMTFVSNGVEAFEFINQQFLPRVLVIDLKMPKQDGLELIKAIRENTKYNHLPIVVFSSSISPVDIRECYQAGANAYVVKTINLTGFVEAVNSIVNFWVNWNVPEPAGSGLVFQRERAETARQSPHDNPGATESGH